MTRPKQTATRTSPASTVGLTLDAVLARLERHAAVTGLLQIGSASQPGFSQSSDYDLVIVLREAAAAWYVGVTWIDQRLTDLIFVADAQLSRLADLDAPITPGHELAPMVPWFQTGRIRYDPDGRLQRLQAKLQEIAWIGSAGEDTVHGAWFAINYNLAQTIRMAASADPLYRATAGLRMAVYGHSDIWFGYFTLRRLCWRGDKAAIAYLREHDPAFLAAFQRFVAEPSFDAKLDLYGQAAALATAPAGGRWSAHSTAMNVEEALAVWQRLLDG